MHEPEKSNSVVVAAKLTNKAERSAAELVEPRTGTKGNVDQQSTRRAQDRESVSQALDRVRKAARQRKKEQFISLLHHVDLAMLRTAFYAMKRDAAPGVDSMTWETYERDLDRKIEDLHARVKSGAYRARPSRRSYIPKEDGSKRPLAVAALEDKIVQRATAAVLSAIYEEDFLGFSYGFRPKRSQHDALDALIVGISSKKVNYILDADIRSFFTEVSQSWVIRFLKHRVGDPRILRLVQKWLRAGVLEDGIVTIEEKGTGQGSVISPLLANVYLHYVFDLWAERWRRREATGDTIVVRYADDIVVGFQHESDARRFWEAMRDRLKEFALSLHPDKTRLIEFGRFAAQNYKKRGLAKPETFTFLGFVLNCDKNSSWRLPSQEEVTRGSHAHEAPGDKGGVATTHEQADPRNGEMACSSRRRLLRLPRRADQRLGVVRIPISCRRPLASSAMPAQSASGIGMDADGEIGRRVPAQAANPSSVAKRAVRRQTPEVGAVCGNSASTDLCGGRSEMSVPTANTKAGPRLSVRKGLLFGLGSAKGRQGLAVLIYGPIVNVDR